MAEEKPNPEASEEKAPKEAPPKKEAAKEEAPKAAAAPEGEEKKSKKVSRMTLTEVEAELKKVKETMGAYQSSFARHLLARKSELPK